MATIMQRLAELELLTGEEDDGEAHYQASNALEREVVDCLFYFLQLADILGSELAAQQVRSSPPPYTFPELTDEMLIEAGIGLPGGNWMRPYVELAARVAFLEAIENPK